LDLFDHFPEKKSETDFRPLAERMRPANLSAYIGQSHLLGEGRLLSRAIAQDSLFSMILWGPPGTGKTTLALLVARESKAHFIRFSAVLSGVKELRTVVEEAKKQCTIHRQRTILFVDEIHRFNKAQQDAFLPHVENGLLTLIGATTENPSFEIISPLLSRCRVMLLHPLTQDELRLILRRALDDRDAGLGNLPLEVEEDALELILSQCNGDARVALNNLEIAATSVTPSVTGKSVLTAQLAADYLGRRTFLYDKSGEEHYNLISAFHKSLRGSDPDASLYWLARMLIAGEDPLFIARRMVRMASEDIGNADPLALSIAIAAKDSFHFIGPPEGELALAQAAVYLATAPKSDAVYKAFNEAKTVVNQTGSLPVPLHIRNAPTKLMHAIGYGKDYKYAHDYEEAYVQQDYLPEEIQKRRFYVPTNRGYEKKIQERIRLWQETAKKV